MRRLLGVILLVSSLALVAATPTPSPSPAPPPPVSQGPAVVVYPFDTQSGTNPKVGAAIAQIIAAEMTATGGINMLPIPSGVARPAFLDYAREHHADYYISGYVTPVGDYASVVSQVVSVDSGVILFSQTAQVTSVADVASQSLQARAQIIAISGRGTQNIGSQGASTPAPSASNGSAMQIKGLGNIVDSVFGHHKSGPTPTPSPVVKPSRGVIVAAVEPSGSIAPADVTNATNELFFAMQHYYNATTTGVTGSVRKNADSICGSSRNNTIATGFVGSTPQKHGKPEILFTLQIYTCFGALLDGEVGKGNTIKAAVDAAVLAYAKAHPDNS